MAEIPALPLRSRPWQRPVLLTATCSAAAALIATRFSHPWVLGSAALIHGSYIFAVLHPQCGWFGPVVTHFETSARELWLTIDDGPAGEDSVRLSEDLARRGVRATFFVKGVNLLRQPEIAARWIAAGHTIANHTHTHPAPFFPWLLPARLRAEIDGCTAAMAAAGAPVSPWFRAPVGLKNVHLHRQLAARKMRLIGWSIRGHDGVRSEPEAVCQRVLTQAQPGGIVLLHEGRPRSVETILRTVDALLARDFTFVIPADAQLR
jgi:peptidoglycan/xylan/chitin deacetylase (PgdA/CDA1 family)